MSSAPLWQPLPASFYNRPTLRVARELLGMYLVRRMNVTAATDADAGLYVGKIVETEAYMGAGDPAAHSAAGRTKRTAILFGEPGRAYVYQMRHHYLLNVVTEPVDTPTCVLLRALEPVQGGEPRHQTGRKPVKRTHWMNGPAKLCRALDIDLTHYGADLTSAASPLFIAHDAAGVAEPFEIETSPRIGISKAVDKPYRFTIKGSPYLSR